MTRASEIELPIVVDMVVVTHPMRAMDIQVWASDGPDGLRRLRDLEAKERLEDATRLGHDPEKAAYWATRWATVHTWPAILSALCLPQVGDLVDVSLSDGSFATLTVRARRVHGRAVQTDGIWGLLCEPVDVNHCTRFASNPPTVPDLEPGPDQDTRH